MWGTVFVTRLLRSFEFQSHLDNAWASSSSCLRLQVDGPNRDAVLVLDGDSMRGVLSQVEPRNLYEPELTLFAFTTSMDIASIQPSPHPLDERRAVSPRALYISDE